MSSNFARQAIFDIHKQVIAYEFLFRDGFRDSFPGIASDVATQSILNDLFIEGNITQEAVSDGLPCFVNFSYQSLIDGTALQYPPENLVVEVLEDCPADSVLFEKLIDLRAKGYCIAFDDFIPSTDWIPFLGLADIIKIDFRAQSLDSITRFVQEYREKFSFKLLAEKIETKEEYHFARELGFDLFQGYQLSKPERMPYPFVA
ncbi:signal transduction protein [Enterovibrio norvegicus FF-33]|uniref:Signal transduction protein n=1 Tax=Enterovibrio norvegicus FF-454 TaxID=1185651 RepID=A0A1E5C099_9GAMM|nr:EAL domain-containing protein [Enterovibrio norvegicus]OEE58933.1 signal transduction protein [Enterovibrio norvegicus FF-454]OEE67912.1 signal transduction protein [Enterovibrio norvegicus FF-33]OEE73989.1 signal transduction protein [Enterovibrio norvegicus FF-162]